MGYIRGPGIHLHGVGFLGKDFTRCDPLARLMSVTELYPKGRCSTLLWGKYTTTVETHFIAPTVWHTQNHGFPTGLRYWMGPKGVGTPRVVITLVLWQREFLCDPRYVDIWAPSGGPGVTMCDGEHCGFPRVLRLPRWGRGST